MSSDQPPTIVHLVDTLSGGGTERTLVSLLGGFDRTRFIHKVVTLRKAGSLTHQLPDDIAVRAFETSGKNRKCAWKLAKYCRSQKAALIHARNTCTWTDAVTARLLACRSHVVLAFHGLDARRSFTRKQRWCAQTALRTGASFTTVAQAGRQQLQQEASVPSQAIRVLENGIDLSRFETPDSSRLSLLRNELGFSHADFVIGTVGSLSLVKNHATLLLAFNHARRTLPHLRLIIVGDGPLRKSLEQQANSLELQSAVRFVGMREDVANLLGGMDAYVCASKSECMSNALLEAMAAGLPVATTQVGDHPKLVRDGVDGLIVPRNNPIDLAGVLVRLAKSPEVSAQMGTSARQRVQKFSFIRTVQAYEEYYEAALKRSETPSEKEE